MPKNKFGIPEDVLSSIRKRDKFCVYCHKEMLYPYDPKNPSDSATIEHLNWDGPFYWSGGLQADDIVICCGACNSSRGQKTLNAWFEMRYCLDKNIRVNTIAAPVRSYLQRQKQY